MSLSELLEKFNELSVIRFGEPMSDEEMESLSGKAGRATNELDCARNVWDLDRKMEIV